MNTVNDNLQRKIVKVDFMLHIFCHNFKKKITKIKTTNPSKDVLLYVE